MYEQTMLETAVLQHCHFAMAMAKFVMLDIIMCITFLSVQNNYPATRFICQMFDKKRYIDNQKIQVADKIKRDIWMLDIIMCITFLSV